MIAMVVPLIAVGVWAAFLILTNGSTDNGMQLSPPEINQTFFFLFVFAVFYAVFVLIFFHHKKHEHAIRQMAIRNRKMAMIYHLHKRKNRKH